MPSNDDSQNQKSFPDPVSMNFILQNCVPVVNARAAVGATHVTQSNNFNTALMTKIYNT
jgi:hypothetical protein